MIEMAQNDIVEGVIAPHGFREEFEAAEGRVVINFRDPADHRLNMDLSVSLLSTLGPILAVYPKDGCWSNLKVKLDADPIRTHGIGTNPLHIDLVDRTMPPRYIALYCVRADPAGGGATILADLHAANALLSEADQNILSRERYSYWTDDGVHGVGTPMDRFSILPPGDSDSSRVIRFTAKMDQHLHEGNLVEQDLLPMAADAFSRFREIVTETAETYLLRQGQMIVFDQYRYAHGRAALGPDQASFTEGQRRLLKQAYVGGRF